MKIKFAFLLAISIILVFCLISCSDSENYSDDTYSSSNGSTFDNSDIAQSDDNIRHHTVKFITHSDSVVEPVLVEHNTQIPVQSKPKRAGYTFDGWYLGDEKWSFISHVVTIDLTLEARWIPNENILFFDGNGASSGSMKCLTIKTDDCILLSQNSFTKYGYTFIGWSTKPNGDVEYNDESLYTMGTDNASTLYAVWQPNRNTLIFNSNGGSGEMSNMIICSDTSTTLIPNAFEKNGYTFMGWSTSKNGTIAYSDGDSYTMNTESTQVLYAVWKINVYEISYETNGGTEKTSNPLTFTIKDLPLKLNDLNNKSNYLFNYWYGESDFSGNPILEITEIGNVTLYAEYIQCTDGLVLEENIDSYTIANYTGSASTVTIPQSYKSKNITSIGNHAFSNCMKLTSVTIPNSVTNIGTSAFQYCTSLTSVTIPNSVVIIGSSAFHYCTNLTSVTIPNSVATIGSGAFYNCTSLNKVNTTSIAAWCSISFENISANPLYYAGKLYSNSELVTELVIPTTVTSIGNYAFSGCISLTNVIIPSSVIYIGDRAFHGCSNLTLHCETAYKPTSWSSNWNSSGCTVVWGYTQKEI